MSSLPIEMPIAPRTHAVFKDCGDWASARPARTGLLGATVALFAFDAICVLLFAAGIYLIPLTQLTIRGEESRWAHVAREMLRTGDWIVPRQQGQPLYSRPPLACGLIALASWARGNCDLLAVRLPGALAIMVTVLVLYAYLRTFLPRTGAVAAAMAFATMAQVLELGRLAETESVFTCLLAGALLLWHGSRLRGSTAGGIIAFALAAAATLTKGPQAPVYFLGSIILYLVLTGNARQLWSRASLLGLLIFAGILASWQLPYLLKQGSTATWQTWTGDAALRFLARPTARDVLRHMLSYPWEILACTLPWSPLLFLYASPRLRRNLGSARPAVIFLVVCLAVSLPTCWFTPTAKTRYFMPLYPCLAALVGIAVQGCLESSRRDWLAIGWRSFLLTAGLVMTVVGAGVILGSLLEFAPLRRLHLPTGPALLFGFQAFLLAAVTWWSATRHAPTRSLSGVVALAAFTGLTSALILNDQARKSVDARPAMARLLAALPADQPLVSFGPLHSLFLYYYPGVIEVVPRPRAAADLDSRIAYFCFNNFGLAEPQFPFPWKLVGEVNCDRYREATPFCRVFVGQRLPADAGPAGPPLERPEPLDGAPASLASVATDEGTTWAAVNLRSGSK